MEKLIVLGTGNALATKCYNTCFAIQKDNEYFLIDTGGGNGILSIFKELEISINHIHDIFMTHEHCDHLLGIVWLIRVIGTNMKKGMYHGDCSIYCHKDLVPKIKTMVEITLQKKFVDLIGNRIFLVSVEDQEHKEIMGYDVEFFDIESTKAKQYGFTLMLDNGKKLTCTGDEPYNEEANYKQVLGSDWLLHEAFCLYSQAHIYKPYEKHHSTVKEACELAERMHISNLILWHTEDTNYENRKKLYYQEGKKYYNGNLYIPNDLESIDL